MNMHLILGVIMVFGSYFTRADVHELKVNDRAYLPPLKTKVNNEYLPPAEKEIKEIVYSQNNQCNLPMIIYNDPSYVQVKSKLNKEHLPPLKEVKDLETKVSTQDHQHEQPKVANDPITISDELPKKNIIEDHKSNEVVKLKQNVNREYLPPLNDKQRTKITSQGYQYNQPKAIPDPLPIKQQQPKVINSPSYQHNQPKAIDDPLPIKVNYIQPLRLDFLDGQLKPIGNGPLFTGLFLNASEIKLSTERVPNILSTKQTKPTEPKPNLKTSPLTDETTNTSRDKELNMQTKEVSYELKTDHTLQNKNYHKKFEEDIVLINYPDAATNFKLFNSDDDTLLSGSAPEVIFKPGDDISFVHDTSIIDDYEHITTKAKKAEMIITTTTTSTTMTPVPLEIYTTEDYQDAEDNEDTLEQEQSNATESSLTERGYAYERPKQKTFKDETTETFKKQDDECGNQQQFHTDNEDNESPIDKNGPSSIEHQTNENDAEIHIGAGYFYEKPKIPFEF